jgi:predicted ArsR family transcriptional regulator
MADTMLHRALAASSRAEMLSLLQASAAPLGIADIGERTGLRPTTIRTHLGVLQRAGLVRAEREGRSTPGRPRVVYRAVESSADAEQADAPTGYRLLAEILAGYLASTRRDVAGEAVDAGREWGRFLVERVAPLAHVDEAAAVDGVQTLLDRLGFAPDAVRTPSGWEVHLHACPFRDIARRHPDVACSVHLGIMRGALGELGVPLGVTRLEPFAERDRCVATVEHLESERG